LVHFQFNEIPKETVPISMGLQMKGENNDKSWLKMFLYGSKYYNIIESIITLRYTCMQIPVPVWYATHY